MRPDAVVIGVGNPYRRDDGVGPAVVARLRAAGLPGVTLAESDGEACALILLWQQRRLAVLVDAVRIRPPHPGQVHRLVTAWPVPGPLEPDRGSSSTHTVALGDAVRLAGELGRLPARMLVFAIEAADLGYGAGLSPAVERAADKVAAEVAAEVRTWATATADQGP
ncbi:hydrogenase maturation protease [Dactylosporangium sp. NPDC049140]|uniref:hydrogenase maturation protease n=1 Tax=Dactylosporangium sp. NPDC049140 TaxID=3155647 RepID=UPI0033D129F3